MLVLQYDINTIEAGCDEAGRGCLAGPVVAAAVILPPKFEIQAINDSKKLSKKKRILLQNYIETNATAYAVAFVMQDRIDEINILNASIEAMHLALDKLTTSFQHIVVDGNRFKKYKNIPSKTIIKGDGKYANIAAASILAKNYRDAYMEQLATQFPAYQWQNNQGYPTKIHREAIKEFGATIHHRHTFTLLPDTSQLSLDI